MTPFCTLCGSTSHYRSTCPKNKWLFTRLTKEGDGFAAKVVAC